MVVTKIIVVIQALVKEDKTGILSTQGEVMTLQKMFQEEQLQQVEKMEEVITQQLQHLLKNLKKQKIILKNQT